MNKKIKKVFFPFVYTHHTPTMLLQEYIDYYNENDNKKFKIVIEYIKSLPDFERITFLLFCEYKSYRLVSEETNVKHQSIFLIIKKIKNDIIDILKNNS